MWPGLSIRQHLFFTSIRYGELIPVFEGVPNKKAAWFREQGAEVLIVTGIAQPRPVRQYARSISTRIHEMNFPDHHPYSLKDMEKIRHQFEELTETVKQVLVLTTEKDAVRMQEFDPPSPFRDACHAIRIHIHFLNEDQHHFDKQIKNYVASNKRSSILYQESHK
jgi:tetraacyldisaccharide 4'-kinase